MGRPGGAKDHATSSRYRGLRGRVLPAVAAALLVVGVLAATASVASRVPSFEVLTHPADLPGPLPPPVSAATPTFAPLSSDFLEERLGTDLEEFLPASATRVKGERADGPSTSDAPGPGGNAGEGPPPTTTTTMLGPVDAPLPQFSELSPSMGADRTHVDPGDHIVYTIAVTNVGNQDFRGELTITAHHPFWTTDSTTPCGDPGVDPDPDEPCVNPPAPVPGTGSDGVHTVQFSFGGTIEPGESIVRQFRVRVNPGTPRGTDIENHAHLDAVGDGEGPETTDTVVVRVR